MDNIFEKINIIIETDKIGSQQEFDEYISNLTNHPDPLREACAYKLDDLYEEKYLSENSIDIFLNAISDINPNVSRMVCKLISNNKGLQEKLECKIIDKINSILDSVSDIEKKLNNKSHAKNKIMFSLYWLLEALSFCISDKFTNDVLKILHSTAKFSDYTIREKTAKILSKMKQKDSDLINIMKSDGNFYVNFYTNLYKN